MSGSNTSSFSGTNFAAPAWSTAFTSKSFDPKFLYKSNLDPSSAFLTSPVSSPTTNTSTDLFLNPLPDIDPAVKAQVQTQQLLYPLYKQALIDQTNLQFAANQANIASTYPYLSQAATESTARNLGASIRFYKEKQQSPANVQDIMASIQGQRSSAADAEYRRALGTAAQAEAAKNFAKGYAGTMLSMA